MKIELNSLVPGAKNIYWYELLWLPTWKCHAFPTDKQSYQLIQLAKVLQIIRDMFDRPLHVHCALRPIEYNKLIGGAKKSAHIDGVAADFHIEGINCDTVRKRLEPTLESLGIRMEDLPGSGWVHVDRKSPPINGSRFFKP